MSTTVLYTITHGGSPTETRPNSFELYLDEKRSPSGRVQLKDLQQQFPFALEHASFVWYSMLQQSNERVWKRLTKPTDYIQVHHVPNASQVDRVAVIRAVDLKCTASPQPNNQLAKFYDSLFAIKYKTSAPPEAEQYSKQRNRQSPKPPKASASSSVSSALDVDNLASAVGSFTSWAKKGIAQAADMASAKMTQLGGVMTIHDYEVVIQKKLADGGFSEVFIVNTRRKPEGAKRVCALKRCLAHSKDDETALRMEAMLHRKVKSRNVMEVLACDVVESKRTPGAKEVLFLFPLYPAGSIQDVMFKPDVVKGSKKWPFPEAQAARILAGICNGLNALHQFGYLHRDIKPHNVLLTSSDITKAQPILMDLGSCDKFPFQCDTRRKAAMLQDEAESKCSAPYRAPELYDVPTGFVTGPECDVWSLGCTLFAMTHGHGWSPFEDPNQGVLKLAIMSGNVKVPSISRTAFSEDLTGLMLSMMSKEPSERPNVSKVLSACTKMSTDGV